MIAERELAVVGTPDRRQLASLSSLETQTELGKKVFSNITEYLATHERFTPQSNAYQKVEGRFRHLYADSKVELLVVNDQEPNAFSTPGYMVVSNGLLRIIEGQEELDAVIAHEMTHLEEEHVEHGVDSGSFFKRIGRTRKHETEADFKPLEFLDRKGVNPYGFVKLFERLEEWKELNKNRLIAETGFADWAKVHADPDHGSLLDRRLNFSQTSWFIDIRNLSLDLKPLDLTEADLKDYEQDDEVAKNFDNLDPIEKRIFLKRQFGKYAKDPQSETEDEKSGFQKLEDLIKKQQKLIDETFTDLPDDKKSEMLLFTLQSDCRINNQILKKVPSIAGLINEWESGLADPERISGFLETGNNPKLEKIGFDNNSKLAENFRLKILNLYLEKQAIISPGSYFELYDRVNSSNPINCENATTVLLDKLAEKNQLNNEQVWILSDLLRDRPVRNSEILATGFEYDPEAEGSIDVSDLGYKRERINIQELLVDQLDAKRIAKLQTLKNPIEFFRYLNSWYDPNTGVDSNKEGATKNLIHQQFQNLEDFLGQVKEHLSTPDKRDSILFLGKATFNEALHEYFLGLSGQTSEQQGDKELTPQKLNSFIELIGLTQSQESMVWMIDNALAATNLKGVTSADLESILNAVNKSALASGIYSGKEIAPIQLNKIPRLVQAAKVVFLNEAVASGDLNKLKKYFSLFPSYNVQPTKALTREVSGLEEGYEDEYDETFDESGSYLESRLKKVEIDTKENWQKLTQKVLNDKSLEPQSRLEMLLFLSSASESPQVLLQVVPEIALRMVKSADFQQGVNIVFEKYPTLPANVFSKALNYLIEEKARTAADFELLESRIKNNIESYISNGEAIGAFAITDAFILDPVKASERSFYSEGISFIKAKGFDPLELMESLLSFESDERLKKYLFDRWWITNQHGADTDSAHRKMFNLYEYLTQKNHPLQLEHWKKETPQDSEYKSLHEVIADVYLMDTVMKFALLRKMLTGPAGVFESELGKEKFAGFISNSLLTSENGQDLDFTRDLITSFFKAGDQEELFDRTSAVIADLILSKPETTFRYDRMATEYARQFLIFAQSKGDFSYRSNAEAVEHIKNVATKIYQLMGSPASKSESGVVPETAANLKLLEEFQGTNGHKEIKKFTPWDLAITVGQKSGALGVRMLQLAGQYFDIPLDQREALDNVYDQNVGQSRLQAYRTLRREAETSPDIARFLDNVEEFKPRIGGGSLMTVYEFVMKDGTREAVAVRNPNVTFHLDKTVTLLRKTLNEAKAKNPQDQNFQLIEVLLDDVSDWIKDELADPDFEIKDRLFKIQNDGWFPDNNDAKKILVPDSLPTGTRWIRRDRYIEGKNLTALEISDQTDIREGKIKSEDLAQSTSLIIKNYVNQLFETGLVHPDMHPGNIRITPDGTQAAIFDRYNLLKLNEQDKEFVGGLVAASAFGFEAVQDQVGNYLFSLLENAPKAALKDQLLSEVVQIFSTAESPEKGLIGAMVHLKRSGVIIPRPISLIAKNLYSLNNMATKAGFSNLVEAYMIA